MVLIPLWAFQHDGAGGNDLIFADGAAIVHDRRPMPTNTTFPVWDATMYDGGCGRGNLIPDSDLCF